MLFFENLDNVLRINTNGFGLAEEENDVKISWSTKLSGIVEGILRAV